MSSSEFSTVLTPEPLLRRCVLWSGTCLTVVGILVVLVQPLALSLRLAATLGWAVISAHRLAVHAAVYRNYHRIRLDCDGTLLLESRDGSLSPARIGPGSIVLARIAWLRVLTGSGSIAGELLRGDARESEAWRRFQVIWRHLGSGS